MSTTSKSLTKVLLAALQAARRSMRAYSHLCSPKTYTQHQLFACLVLKEFLKLDYRGTSKMLDEDTYLRQVLELKTAPHFTTLQKASARLLKGPRLHRLLRATLEQAQRSKRLPSAVALAALDSSGFEAQHVSSYFVHRRAKGGKITGKWQSTTYRTFPKLAVLCDTASHLILSVHVERGPKPDIKHFRRMMRDVPNTVRIRTLAADAGYDAEWVHVTSRERFGVRALIPAKIGRPTSKPPRGRYRRWFAAHLKQTRYTQRWQDETVFSMLKRRLSETLGARTYWSQYRAGWLKALVHNLMILWRVIWGFLQSRSDPFYRTGRARHGPFQPAAISLGFAPLYPAITAENFTQVRAAEMGEHSSQRRQRRRWAMLAEEPKYLVALLARRAPLGTTHPSTALSK